MVAGRCAFDRKRYSNDACGVLADDDQEQRPAHAGKQHDRDRAGAAEDEHPALDARILFKAECLQRTGSFKFRGAVAAVSALPEGARGVLAWSSGNHAQGVAAAARLRGLPCVIVMPADAPAVKRATTRALGAEVVLHDRAGEDREAIGLRLAAARGLHVIRPFDDAQVIAGQGTVALELLEELPNLAAVVVPVSGGGLAAGVALALRAAGSPARVLGVSQVRGAAMHASLRAGHPVDVEEVETLADSLRGGIGLENRYTFAALRAHLAGPTLVDEPEIRAAMRWAYRRLGLRLEGAAAVGLAYMRGLPAGLPRGPIAVLLTGRNVDEAAWRQVLETGPAA